MLILNKKIDIIPVQALYIGRGSALGNPFAIGIDGVRDEVIADFEVYLNKEIDSGNPVIIMKLRQLLEASVLACYCKPAACHGDIIEKVWRARIKDLVPARSLLYAGIGSRSIPPNAQALLTKLARRLDELGFMLRSGAANGADTSFEVGATNKEIFLPWQGFNGRQSNFYAPTPEAFRIAEQLHPAWASLTPVAKKLMARNSHQVLGESLRSPVDFVACWTPDGAETSKQRSRSTGGTGQAIDLADRFDIPVFNFRNPDAMSRLTAHILSNPYLNNQELSAPRC